MTQIHNTFALRFVFAFLALGALFFEFFFDLSTELIWQRVVLGIDWLLVLVFFLHVAHKFYLNRHQITFFLRRDSADLLVVLVSLSVLYAPRMAAAIVICRLLVSFVMRLLDSRLGRRLVEQMNLRPSQTLALSFMATILVGTLLLTFPAATQDGRGANLLDALFTITSATCVTGLSVVDIGSYFSRFGQGIILMAIQVGGLGIMVLSAAFAVLVGGHLASRRQAGLTEMMDIRTTEGLKNLLQAVIGVTFTVELCGTLLLFILLRHDIPHFGERLWWSLFHAVSAFCNAGFSLAPNNLESFVSRPMISFVFMFLITLGGLGFFVIGNIFNRKTWQVLHPIAVWSRFHTQTKIVLVATCVLNLFGMILFLFLEYDGVLFSLSLPEKLNAAIFEAVTLRTAGFTLVPQANLQLATVIFCVMWMFIGASPGSTGGGIKTTTMAVALLAVKSMLRGREDVDIFNRRVSPATVSRSLSIVLIATGIVVVFLMFLASTQSLSFERLLFESVSAFGTVGLSMNATEELNSVGRLLIIVLMFVGRIGPLTLALAVGERRFVKGVRLPEGRIAVG